MTDLLLITDVPRLRKIFSKLHDNRDLRLRIANNLEKGAEELVAEKPAIIFVQTHLSGLSAEIILMHLKKQLGRKRSRFVLLATPAQATGETFRLYQGHIDTSLDDDAVLSCIKNQIASLLAKGPKKTVEETVAPEPEPAALQTPQSEPPLEHVPAIQEAPAPNAVHQDERTLVDQGITYAPRPRMSVYSEFNSSFDSAVNDMNPPSTLAEVAPEQGHTWVNADIETVEHVATRSNRASFLVWLAPVVIAAVVFTFMQQKRTTPSSPAAPPQVQAPAPAEATARTTVAEPAAVPEKNQPPAAPKPAAGPDQALSDKAVISAISESRAPKKQADTSPTSGRPAALPDFIPRSGADKAYAQANPGWERYKGQVTEFKVFREGGAIKAIQVIDRGGNGVPESFMKAAVRQVSKNPAFAVETSEKKEGYEIQRGRISENLKVMYYRDEQGGKLRAFVLTWQ